MFLQAMPKGGDLHTHLSGAVYPERYVDWALADGLCIDPEGAFLSAPPCDGLPALRRALDEGLVSRGELVDAWSLRAAAAMPDAGTRHDHFFGVGVCQGSCVCRSNAVSVGAEPTGQYEKLLK